MENSRTTHDPTDGEHAAAPVASTSANAGPSDHRKNGLCLPGGGIRYVPEPNHPGQAFRDSLPSHTNVGTAAIETDPLQSDSHFFQGAWDNFPIFGDTFGYDPLTGSAEQGIQQHNSQQGQHVPIAPANPLFTDQSAGYDRHVHWDDLTCHNPLESSNESSASSHQTSCPAYGEGQHQAGTRGFSHVNPTAPTHASAIAEARKGKSRRNDNSTAASMHSKVCPGIPTKDCGVKFRTTNDPEQRLCTQCLKDKVKLAGMSPHYHLTDQVPNFGYAHEQVYPLVGPLNLADDDVPTGSAQECEVFYVQQFLDAINTAYKGASGDLQNKQSNFNLKPYHQPERYSNHAANVHVRMLYHSVRVYHCGGRYPYPIDGDNDGHGKPRSDLKFSVRMKLILDQLRTNKQIAMNVIEGRNVLALVWNPTKLSKRKSTNDNSNSRKKGQLDLAKKVQEEQQSSPETSARQIPDSSQRPVEVIPRAFAGPSSAPGSLQTSRLDTYVGEHQGMQETLPAGTVEAPLPFATGYRDVMLGGTIDPGAMQFGASNADAMIQSAAGPGEVSEDAQLLRDLSDLFDQQQFPELFIESMDFDQMD